MTDERRDEWIVMASAARMPAKTRGQYRRVALVRVAEGAVPKMISDRALGAREIYRSWEKCNVGTSARCAYVRAVAEALALAVAKSGQGQVVADIRVLGVAAGTLELAREGAFELLCAEHASPTCPGVAS